MKFPKKKKTCKMNGYSHMQRRFENPSILCELRILRCDQENKFQDTSEEFEKKLKNRKTCHLCPSLKKRKQHIYTFAVENLCA